MNIAKKKAHNSFKVKGQNKLREMYLLEEY